jgi:Predicted ATPase (AAA+ superfamily)
MSGLVGEVGNWVSGQRFWGREHELSLLLKLIEDGANVSIIAQRRIGKTSLMHEAGDKLPQGYIGLHIDLQAAQDVSDVVVKIVTATRDVTAIWPRIGGCFGNFFQSVKDSIDSISVYDFEVHLKAGLSGNAWQDKGSQALSELAKLDKPVVLFIDELPILIDRLLLRPDGRESVHTLLCWLRNQSQLHQGRICMIFAGSIGLEPVLGRIGLTADINHLTPFVLEPWVDDVAMGCLNALATYQHLELPRNCARNMLELLGCNIPYHVQLFFFYMHEYCRAQGKTSVLEQDVKEVFDRRMLNTKGHSDLTHMESRLLKMFTSGEFPFVRDVLTQAAIAGRIRPIDIRVLWKRNELSPKDYLSIVPHIFDVIEHDGYLQKCSDGSYEFVSNLLRLWWKAKYEAFYELLAEN